MLPSHPVGTVALVALLTLSSAQLPLVASGATIQNVVAPCQSNGPPLNFKGNTAWPYGLCEVSWTLADLVLHSDRAGERNWAEIGLDALHVLSNYHSNPSFISLLALTTQTQKKGDCDSDSDCDPGLSCFQRSGNTAVPGCTRGGGGDRSDVDYCVGDPTSNVDAAADGGELADVAGDLDDADALLGRCEADCDDDDECASGLVCYQRDDDEPVPGCNGTPRSGWDYCIRESDLELLELMDTDEPTLRPTLSVVVEEETTAEPTRRPTVKPTPPPPGVVFSFPEGLGPGKGEMQRCMGDCDKGEWS